MRRDLRSSSAVDALFGQPLGNIVATLRECLDVSTLIAGELPFATLPGERDRIAYILCCTGQCSTIYRRGKGLTAVEIQRLYGTPLALLPLREIGDDHVGM